MMNIIAESWMLCMLASHWDEDSGDGDYDPTDYIGDYLEKHYSGRLFKYTPIKNDTDFAFILETDSHVFDATRGTHGKKAWKGTVTDFLTSTDGVMPEFKSAALKMWPAKKKYLVEANRRRKEVVHVGHSRGGAVSQYDQYLWRDKYGIYSKCISFCSPRLVNKAGKKAFKGLDHIRVWMRNDIVDNVGADAFKGVHAQRKAIKLPKKKGMTLARRLLNMIPEFGHAYSSVNESLVEYFYNRGMKREAEFLKSIKDIAEI